jgi:hypothetical protein
MTEKTVITCDALNCCNEYEHTGGDFMICDITGKGWVYVPGSETHYCKDCGPEIIKELKRDNIEYIT